MDWRYAGRRGGGGGGGGSCVARYDSGGGVARYVGGGGGGYYDASMVNRMMLKFRPITPKPAASSGSGSGDSTAENGCKTGRPKRRYVRVKNIKSNNKDDCKKRKVSTTSFDDNNVSDEIFSGGGDAVVTLSLMPETPDRKEEEESPVICYSRKPSSRDGHVESVTDHEGLIKRREQTVSFVTVECVTDTWMGGEGGIGWMEEQRVRSLESDTCPGFVSDGGDRVVWVNKAYREMAAGGDEVVVVLVRKAAAAPVVYPAAFTCRVKVTFRKGMPVSTLTVPCDTWRIGSGGWYAWRLDVKAALCLGR